MALNSIASKLEQLEESRESKRDKRLRKDHTTTSSLTSSITLLEGLSKTQLQKIRASQLEPIDLASLKKKYHAFEGLGRRIAPRYSLRLSVVVFSPGRSFRTETVNVSENGLLLKDLLPSHFMNSPIEILISYEGDENQRHHLLFRAVAVGGPLRTARVAFQAATGRAFYCLQNLILDLTPAVA